jgi:hypothetical protein
MDVERVLSEQVACYQARAWAFIHGTATRVRDQERRRG